LTVNPLAQGALTPGHVAVARVLFVDDQLSEFLLPPLLMRLPGLPLGCPGPQGTVATRGRPGGSLMTPRRRIQVKSNVLEPCDALLQQRPHLVAATLALNPFPQSTLSQGHVIVAGVFFVGDKLCEFLVPSLLVRLLTLTLGGLDTRGTVVTRGRSC